MQPAGLFMVMYKKLNHDVSSIRVDFGRKCQLESRLRKRFAPRSSVQNASAFDFVVHWTMAAAEVTVTLAATKKKSLSPVTDKQKSPTLAFLQGGAFLWG